MGSFGTGPFDNDSALDFLEEFLDVESPIRSVRAALARLDEDCYHEIDDVYQAWAACELVAIVSSGGKGYDVDDLQYEAASRLRPNKKLVDLCLKTLSKILDKNSELSDLVDNGQRSFLESSLRQTNAHLKQGLALDKFPRLKVPKIKAIQAYAVASGEKWFIALYDHTRMVVLDAAYDQRPKGVEQIDSDDMAILFNCRYLGSLDEFAFLGRLRPAKTLTESNAFVTLIGRACSSSSDSGNFETSYWLNRGQKYTRHHYEDVREYPFCPELLPEQFAEMIEDYVATGTLRLPPVPTPTELRNKFIERCRGEWERYLDGDGGGPFSFPYLYRIDIAPYALPWIKIHLRTDWTNTGMCLPDDLMRYFLAGLVAASIGAYAESEVPASLLPILQPLRPHIGDSEIRSAIHILSCVLDEASVIPHMLRDDPPRRTEFLSQAYELREGLAATLTR